MIFAFFISFIICWLLFDIAARVMTWMGARWSEWKIISVDCMAKLIFERLNSRAELAGSGAWRNGKRKTLNNIWKCLHLRFTFSVGRITSHTIVEFKRWKSRPESFHNFIDKKRKTFGKNKRFQCKKAPGPYGAKQKQHREAAQMENYEEKSVQQSWLRSKNWKAGNTSTKFEISFTSSRAYFSSTRRRSSSHWPYLRKRAKISLLFQRAIKIQFNTVLERALVGVVWYLERAMRTRWRGPIMSL